MLLNAAKCQSYNFYRFWVIKEKPTREGKSIPSAPSQIRVNNERRAWMVCLFFKNIINIIVKYYCFFPFIIWIQTLQSVNFSHSQTLLLSLQTHHVHSTFKQHGKERFHVISIWDKRVMFVGITHLVIAYFIRCLKVAGLEGKDFETTPQTHHVYSTLKCAETTVSTSFYRGIHLLCL